MAREPARLVGDFSSIETLRGTHARQWVIDINGFIHIDNSGVYHTMVPGFQDLALRTYSRFKEHFDNAALAFDVPVAILVATACCESAGQPEARRVEYTDDQGDGILSVRDKSYGLCQLLTGTAYQVGRAIRWPREANGKCVIRSWTMPRKHKHDYMSWFIFLTNPAVNIALCGAYYMFMHRRHPDWHQDPILLYASFNAGGAYHSDTIPWGLHSTPAAIDAFRNYYSDFKRDVG